MHTTRREFVQTLISGAVGLSITSPASGQAPTPITATKLTPTLALLAGNGGNMALVIGSDGLMLVDAGLPDRAAELLKAAADLGSPPVTTLFNTHWHYDHVGANEALGKGGAAIIAHENTRKHLASGVFMEALKMKIEPMAGPGLPAKTFSAAGKMAFEKTTLEYVPVPPAHTDGDAYVFFPEANVLHTGDLLFTNLFPFIDYSTGGWLGGMIAACDTMYKACDADTRVIPGHGALATRDDLRNSRDMLTRVHERLSPFARKGASVEDVVKAAPTREFDAAWGKGFMNPETFVRVAYTSLVRHGG